MVGPLMSGPDQLWRLCGRAKHWESFRQATQRFNIMYVVWSEYFSFKWMSSGLFQFQWNVRHKRLQNAHPSADPTISIDRIFWRACQRSDCCSFHVSPLREYFDICARGAANDVCTMFGPRIYCCLERAMFNNKFPSFSEERVRRMRASHPSPGCGGPADARPPLRFLCLDQQGNKWQKPWATVWLWR